MKLRLPRLSPAARIALGLVSLIVTLLFVVDLGLNLVPDQTDIQKRIRESTSERLAVQITSLIQNQEWDTLNTTVQEALNRDKEIRSLAVRRTDGHIVIKAGDHFKNWRPPAGGKSTLTDVQVPIYANKSHWGDVEISYTPTTPQSIKEWLQNPLVALILIVAPAGFLAFYLYMRRALQYLDPSAAIPDRVRAAFDALNEGVVILDKNGRVMLFNKTFMNLHPSVAESMIGKQLSGFSWLTSAVEDADLPWERVIRTQSETSGHAFAIAQPDNDVVKVIVNAAPILDTRNRLRGCLVTFYDQTELHAANEKMRSALIALEASREQVEKQNEELMRLATRDPMTGCYNRRAFFSSAEPLFEKMRQEARDMSCIMIDIDHFKKINDTWGHTIGDQVIIDVARSLSSKVRPNDLVCRFGGEEFCLILPNASSDTAMEIAERLRTEIMEHGGQSIRSIDGLRFTCSFGVVSLASGAESLAEMIELADFSLYTSKRTGRNKVTLWNEDLSTMQPEQGATITKIG